ncbi:MAG: ATP-binding cassette domain-containing protein [Beijerinckiaceae bacterium]|nr:ATP-binding cassette domain-containing protein [Beijerinckiaceae bacterium]
MIEFDNLVLSYPGGARRALDHVSLSIPSGAFVALVGASGSGKTSLLKTINRLIDPTSGVVRVDGEDVSRVPAPDLRRRIGYAFQGVGLFPHMSVAENIAVTPRLLGWPGPEIDARVRELLELVDLPQDFSARAPAMLSGGQQQRVGVARALAARPSVMLMDEPFGALDPLTRDTLGDAYRALHDKLGLTTIMVTHDIQEAVLLADRIIVMEAGKPIADGGPRTLLRPDADPRVAAMMDVPRRQAARVQAMLGAADV